MAPRRQTGKGRSKIEIRRIESKEARDVCFSKRRVGLFNKVSELGIMCGVEVAAVAFAPAGGKAFSIGHPSVESVLDRFSPSNSWEAQGAAGVGAGDLNQALVELNRENGQLRARLGAEKARKKATEEPFAKALAEGSQAAAWLDAFVCQMGEEDLVAFEAALEKLDAAVAAHADKVHQEALLTRLTVYGGGGGFDFGGTSGGMDPMLQLQMMMVAPPPPPAALAPGTDMMAHGFGPHGLPQ